MKKSLNLKNLLKFSPLIGFGLFLYILHTIGLEQILSTFAHLSFEHMVFAGLYFTVNLLLRTLRWYRLLQNMKISVSFVEACCYYLASIFYGSVTWGRVGELYKMRLLNKKEVSGAQSLFLSAIDRIIDILFLALFIALFTVFATDIAGGSTALTYTLVLLTGLLVGYLGYRLFRFFFEKNTEKKIIIQVIEFFEHFKRFLSTWAFFELVLLTMVTWVFYVLAGQQVAMGLKTEISFLNMAFILFFAIIISLIPITFQGFGTRDFIFIQAAIYLGFKTETGIAISIGVIIVMFSVSVLIGALGILYENLVINRQEKSNEPTGQPPAK